MNELFIPQDLAIELQQLGYQGDTLCVYRDGELKLSLVSARLDSDIPAPLWQQATDWLREEEDIQLAVMQVEDDIYDFDIISDRGEDWENDKTWDDYYLAMEEGIKECINIIREGRRLEKEFEETPHTELGGEG